MDILNDVLANDLYRKLILSALVLITQAVIRRLFLSFALNRIPNDSPHLYSVRKVTGFVITMLTALFLFGIWVQRLGDLSVALGILAAGLAFALQEVIGSIAGWITIISGKPFSLGDRIETGGIRGDVVDISVLRTTLMEIGSWLSGDHNTGRIVTLSNAFLFKEPLYNYSAHLNFVWDEVKVPVTYESNWKRATEIMINAVCEHSAYQELLPKAEKQRREVRRKLAVKMTPLKPRAYVKLTDNWIELGLVYPVDTDLRRSLRSEISQQILKEFVQEGITVASQTIAIVQFPSIDIHEE
ncbi:MAG: mechanosensitive ion channel family protein [Anaerolineales bacterium]|nr:mechanosensitive ion channel family protein [Anaerolineales bacterium]